MVMEKFPHIEVTLEGVDSNALSIIGVVTKAMKKAGVSKEEIDAYRADATSGDHDHLMMVTFRTVAVVGL